MKKTLGARSLWAIALSIAMLVAVGGELGCFESGEAVWTDLWHVAVGKRREPEHVVLAVIDDATLLALKDEPIAFWGPHWARAMGAARAAGARAIGLDLLLLASPEAWLDKIGIHDVVARKYDAGLREEFQRGDVALVGLLLEKDLLLPGPQYIFALKHRLADVGLGNFISDADGVVRSFAPALRPDGAVPNLSFAALLAAVYRGEQRGEGVFSSQEARRIGFLGPPGAFPRISLKELIADAPLPQRIADMIRGKIVIIAAEFSGARDVCRTPYSGVFSGRGAGWMTGAEIHANIIETLLSNLYPKPAPRMARIALLLLLTGAATWLSVRLSSGKALFACAGLVGLAMLVSWLAFRGNALLPLFGAQLAILFAYVTVLAVTLAHSYRFRDWLKGLMALYLSKEATETILSPERSSWEGIQETSATILYSDIRDFTSISEVLTPKEVVETLNEYLERACAPLHRYKGAVNKFIGDAVLVVFSKESAGQEHARLAIAAALELAKLQAPLTEWMRARFQGKKLPTFRLGVGLHTGRMILGDVGARERRDFTVIGDAVNVASRLEGKTKVLGWTIVASSETVRAAGEGVVVGRSESVEVKGRSEPVFVYELLGLKEETQ
jgi:class 3 adenylate cyclase/CHASE2 domain-containing sensor protein